MLGSPGEQAAWPANGDGLLLRRAVRGSTHEAQCAGRYQALKATRTKIADTPASVSGSNGARSAWSPILLLWDVNREMTAHLELHKPNFEGLRAQIQARHTDGQMKSPRPRAPRIDIENPIALELSWLMGMAADNHAEASGARVQVQPMHVVQNVNEDPCRLRHDGFRQSLSPILSIDVSAHSNHNSKFSESGENSWLSHVSGMENQLGTAKGLKGLRAQQAVSIRDQANSRGRVGHREILMAWLLRAVGELGVAAV